MSCVIGLKSGNSIYFAADSAATTEDGDRRPIITEKIIRNGDYLIGFAGSVRTGQLLTSHYFTPPDNIRDFVEELRHTVTEAGSLITSESGNSMISSCFIIAHKNKLYEILSDFQLNKPSGDFVVIGAGTPYAYAAMDALHDQDLSPSQKLITTLEIVVKYQVTVAPPFVVEKY